MFIIEPDCEGEPCIHYARSSQSTTFIPEGRDGYRIFKTQPPDGCPPIAGLKSDEEWEKEKVMSAVRRWYHHFKHPSQEEAHAARDEWERRFIDASTPHPPAWKELPRRHQGYRRPVQSVHYTPHFQTAAASQLFHHEAENPRVNPIISGDRCAALPQIHAPDPSLSLFPCSAWTIQHYTTLITCCVGPMRMCTKNWLR